MSAAFATIEGRGVGKVYGRERALHAVDFRLRAGEGAALLGPNGAGKTTLVSILATLSRPTSGAVRFDGERASARHRGGIGVIAHESLCYGELSARENLAFFATLHAVPEPRARIAVLLDRVGLTDAADRPARTFSRGMLQRLAVARALLHAPCLLLLDEPFTGLDRDGSAMLTALLAEEKRRGAMLLIVTHDLEPLPGLVERALILRRGRLAYDGPAPDSFTGFRDLYLRHAGLHASTNPVQGAA